MGSRNSFLSIVIAIGINIVFSGTANALSFSKAFFLSIAVYTSSGISPSPAKVAEEDLEVKKIWNEYRAEKAKEGKKAIGQAAKDDNYPTNLFPPSDIGKPEILTYFFIDPSTGLPTNESPGFTVSSVLYEAILSPPTDDPNLLTQDLIDKSLTVIGQSSDATRNFPVTFINPGFESVMIAFPYDANGVRIDGEGTASFVIDAPYIIEPTTFQLMLAGGAALWIACRCKKRVSI